MSDFILTYYGIGVVSAVNPVRLSATTIDLDLTISVGGVKTVIPFTAYENDVEVHGQTLYAMADNGDFGEVQ